MKKLFIFCQVLAATSLLYAQDIIVTTDAQKIDAKILEVSKTEIKYKETANLDGPTFILSTEEITSIIYANGKVTLYNTSPLESTTSSTKQNSDTILLLNGNKISGEIKEMTNYSVKYLQNGKIFTLPVSQISTLTLANGQVKTYNQITNDEKSEYPAYSDDIAFIERDNNGNYFLGGEAMSYDQYLSFLQENCQSAYESYIIGTNLKKAGITIIGLGSMSTVIGIMLGALGMKHDKKPMLIAGGLLVSTGVLSIGPGIPLYLTGKFKRRNAYETYNEECAREKTQLTLNVKTYHNGIGLALNF